MIAYADFSAFSVTLAGAFLVSLVVLGIALFTRRVLPNLSSRERELTRNGHAIDRLVYLSGIACWVFFSAININQYNHLLVDPNDFGIFDQVIWNSLHGRLFENTFFYDAPVLLGQRFSPILLAIVPLYAVFPNSYVLGVLTPALIIVAGLPLYWLARERMGRQLAIVILFAYFLMPGGMQTLSVSVFHESMIAMPLLMFATFFLLKRQYKPFLVCLGLALLCKEEIGFIAAGFGLYLAIVHRKIYPGILLTLFSILWTGLLLFAVIPHFQGGNGYYYLGGAARYQYYGYLGNSVPEVATTILTRPDVVAEHILIPAKINILVWFLIPLALLPLAGIEVAALALPTLGYTLLSDVPAQFGFGKHHYGPVFVFLFVAAVIAMERIANWLVRVSRPRPLQILQDWGIARAAVGGLLLGASVTAFLYSLELPMVQPLAYGWAVLTDPAAPHDLAGHALARGIPQDAAVLVQDDLAALVSERQAVYRPMEIPCYGVADYLFLDQQRSWYGYRQPIWDNLISRPDYQTVEMVDGYILKRRAPMQHPLDIQFDKGHLSFLGFTFPLSDTVRGNQKILLTLALLPNDPLPAPLALEIRVTDSKGHLWALNEDPFCGKDFQMDKWRPGALIVEAMTVRLPPTMPTDRYTVSLVLMDRRTDEPVLARDETGQLRDEVVLTALPLQKDKSSFPASDLEIPARLLVDMQDVRLLGYVPPRQSISPGELLQVGLYWRARAKPRGDYMVAVQLRDSAGQVVFEQSSRPAEDTYPTTQWDSGEVLLDWHDFNLPKDIATGEYQIYTALKDADGGRVLGETKISNISIVK